jgi:hypothetical protein
MSESEESVLTNGRLITLRCHIAGIVPTIMSNGQMADPANYWAQLTAEIRSEKKRGKSFTQEQADRYYKALFTGQLYLKDRKNMAVPCWPAENVEAMIRGGAKKSRSGQAALVGVSVTDDFPLIYDGPKTADGLWDDGRFRFDSMPLPKGGGSRTVNCRARFFPWELKFDVLLDTRLADPSALRRWLEDAAWQVGLSAWTPKYGRFEVKAVEEIG